MKLYNIPVEEFTYKDKETGEPWKQVGTWVGSNGEKRRQVHIPVIGPAKNESNWGVIPSRSGRPKIVADTDLSDGVIMRIFPHGFGHIVGSVYVSMSSAPNVMILAEGIGGGVTKQNEYLVMVTDTATFYVISPSGNSELMFVEGGDVSTQEDPLVDLDEFVNVSNPGVTRWLKS